MSWIVPQVQGGSFILPGGEADIPIHNRTSAQQRNASGVLRKLRSDAEIAQQVIIDDTNARSRVRVGRVTTAATAATYDGGSNLINITTDGTADIYDDDGNLLHSSVNLQNDMPRNIPVGAFVAVESHGATPFTGGINLCLGILDGFSFGDHTTAAKTANYVALPGDLVRADTSGGSFTVSLPDSAPVDTEVSIYLVADDAAEKLTIEATGTGAGIVGGRVPVLSGTDVELFVTGDYVRLKHIGSNDWLVIDSHLTLHATELRASTSTGQTIPNNSATVLEYATEPYDVGGIGDLANDRVVIRRAGRYAISAFLNWGSGMSAGTGLAQIVIRVGGANQIFQQTAIDLTSWRMTLATTLDLAAGDIVDVTAFQSNGGDRALATGTPSRLTVAEIR